MPVKVVSVGDSESIRGDLQQEIMKVLWARSAGSATSVEDVREGLPPERRGAYTTVQTVLNRLADKGLVVRRKQGRTIQYAAAVSEPDYLAGSLQRTLKGASAEARQSALANLVEELGPQDLEAISDVAAEIRRRRNR